MFNAALGAAALALRLLAAAAGNAALPSAAALALRLLAAAAGERCISGEGNRTATSLLMPSAATFDVGHYILVAEFALVGFLLCVDAGLVESVPAIPNEWFDAQPLWFLANASQAAAAVLYSTRRLATSALAVAASAAALVGLGSALASLEEPLASLLLATPVWLHAGWAGVAALVHGGVALAAAGAPSTLLVATSFAALLVACGAGFTALAVVGLASLPLVAVVAWALYGIGEANAAATFDSEGGSDAGGVQRGGGVAGGAGLWWERAVERPRESSEPRRGAEEAVAAVVVRDALARSAFASAAVLFAVFAGGSLLALWRQGHAWQEYDR